MDNILGMQKAFNNYTKYVANIKLYQETNGLRSQDIPIPLYLNIFFVSALE